MTNWHNLNQTNRDLRNQSFRGLDLKGINFSGSDLRGCDFSHALLVGAKFVDVRTGLTTKKLAVVITVAVLTALLTTTIVSRTIFFALGKTPEHRGWSYIVVLLITLGLAATAGLKPLSTRFGWSFFTLSGATSAAFLGFCCVAIVRSRHVHPSIAAAVVLGLLMGSVSFRFRTGVVPVAVATAGAVTGYGLSFWLWARSMAFLSGQRVVVGIGLCLLSLAYLGLTISSLWSAVRESQKFAGTSFRNADLTDALFERTKFAHTDFAGAIGYLEKPATEK